MQILNRPLPVVIVSILFIVTGVSGIVYHYKEFFEPNNDLYELTWALMVRLSAIGCGILLLFRYNAARWFAVIWLVYHVLLSLFHPISELIAHIVLLLIVSILLFLPVSTAYFKRKNR